jgi:O-antigen ligase
MTAASQALRIDTDSAVNGSMRLPLQLLTGFFFAFRFCLTLIAFQSNPRAGTVTNLACSGLLLAAALIYTIGDERASTEHLRSIRTLWWLAAYILITGISLLWTGAESTAIAAGYWAGMAIDVATVLLFLRTPNVAQQADALMKGFVVGMLVVAAAAWMSPTLPDLRIGNEEFLHPNTIGLYTALGFFLAQHLAFERRGWRWCCLALGVTLLRSISKTSIVAFLIAESFYLLREKQLSRWMKIKIAAVAAVVIAAFGTLLEAYFAIYTTTGNQAETLTGRTWIWATSFLLALDAPWLGHGLYSYRALIPAFGTFEPWHAHDELLQQFFELGAVGVAITAGLYLSLFVAAKRNSISRYGKLGMVTVIFCVLRGITDTLNFGLSLPLWLFAALAVTLAQPGDAQEVTVS